jgi:hypothetical protein
MRRRDSTFTPGPELYTGTGEAELLVELARLLSRVEVDLVAAEACCLVGRGSDEKVKV